MKNEISILLADDHTMIRKGIRMILEQQNYFKPEIDEASDGNEVLDLISKNNYDVVILDLNIPKTDGLSVIRKFKKNQIDTPILVMTMHNEENIIMEALDCGALGYILKNAEPDELIKAVMTVKKRGKFYCNDVAQIIIGAKDRKTKNNTNFTDHLTKREKEILALIVKGKTSKDIASDLKVSIRTIEHHRINIRSKLNISTTSGLIKFVLENRYFQNN